MITPAAGVGKKAVERFVREAAVLAKLDHPHIVRHLESGTADGVVFLVMELVNGTDAGQILKPKGPLPVAVAVRMACQTLSGLAHAHEKGFVHRDVKPGNLLVGGPAGKRAVKVADFGLARAYDECNLSGLTMQGEVGGTPAYMALEQVTHFRDVRPAADQYSAAATPVRPARRRPAHRPAQGRRPADRRPGDGRPGAGAGAAGGGAGRAGRGDPHGTGPRPGRPLPGRHRLPHRPPAVRRLSGRAVRCRGRSVRRRCRPTRES